MSATSPLNIGEPAPWFSVPSGSDGRGAVMLDELAGRTIVLFFFGSAGRPEVAEVLGSIRDRHDLFDGERCLYIGISNDPQDFSQGRLGQSREVLTLLDSAGVATRQYVSVSSGPGQGAAPIRPVAFVLSPALQIVEIIELTEPAKFVERIVSVLGSCPGTSAGAENAPVLVVPRIFDGSFCEQLIEGYERSGGREIGSIEQGGNAVEKFDPKFRQRFDWYISEEQTVAKARVSLERRLLPMVYRAFQFRTTRIERYLVGCYDSEKGGHFRAHRDNTAPVVAHRRFAVTINLNGEYDGGNLRFPEFGHQSFRVAPGDAIVFSCSLLHEVTPVTRGRRYAFLSFFYDEPSQQLRDEYRRKWMEMQKAAGS